MIMAMALSVALMFGIITVPVSAEDLDNDS